MMPVRDAPNIANMRRPSSWLMPFGLTMHALMHAPIAPIAPNVALWHSNVDIHCKRLVHTAHTRHCGTPMFSMQEAQDDARVQYHSAWAHLDYIISAVMDIKFASNCIDEVMDGGTRRGYPSLVRSFFSVVLSLEDARSRKELAEDWIGDKDGLLIFVRRTCLFP
jgi:hypothetical protein